MKVVKCTAKGQAAPIYSVTPREGGKQKTGFDHVTETSGELSWAMCGRGESFCFPPFPQDSCNLWQFLLT